MVVVEAEDVARTSDLHVGWYNCAGGLLAKIDVIKLLIAIHDFDIFFISETEIKCDTDVTLFSISGYSLWSAGTSSSGLIRSAV
jgi:hypothetical protein